MASSSAEDALWPCGTSPGDNSGVAVVDAAATPPDGEDWIPAWLLPQAVMAMAITNISGATPCNPSPMPAFHYQFTQHRCYCAISTLGADPSDLTLPSA